MKVTGFNRSLGQLGTNCLLVVAVSETDLGRGRKQADIRLAEVNSFLSSSLIGHLRAMNFDPKKHPSTIMPLNGKPKGPKGILVVSFKGSDDEFMRVAAYRKFAKTAAEYAVSYGFTQLCVVAEGLVEDVNLEAMLEVFALAHFSYSQKTKKETKKKISSVKVLGSAGVNQRAVARALARAKGIRATREIILFPPDIKRPDMLAEHLEVLFRGTCVAVEVLDEDQLRNLGAGGVLAVARGSSSPARFVKLSYLPTGFKKSDSVIGLVGKGVTFDSGGLNIKVAQGMDLMKGDCAGAAAVVGAMLSISELKPKQAIIAYVPLAENMPGGDAYRVGDIITMLDGSTVEVRNTDAEGRMLLADALVMACEDGCNTIIDVATLTGACLMALGEQYAGLFTNNQKLLQALRPAEVAASERFWLMPLAPEYRDELKSPVADCKHLGDGSPGGAITAALFLERFIKDGVSWAHLDVAGAALQGLNKGNVPGFGVGTLVNFILNQAA